MVRCKLTRIGIAFPLVVVSLFLISSCRTMNTAESTVLDSDDEQAVWTLPDTAVLMSCEKIRVIYDEDIGEMETGDRLQIVQDGSGSKYLRHHSFGYGASRETYHLRDNAPNAYSAVNMANPETVGVLNLNGTAAQWTVRGSTIADMKCTAQTLVVSCRKSETVRDSDGFAFQRGSSIEINRVADDRFEGTYHSFGLGASRTPFTFQAPVTAGDTITYTGVRSDGRGQGELILKLTSAPDSATGTWTSGNENVSGMPCTLSR